MSGNVSNGGLSQEMRTWSDEEESCRDYFSGREGKKSLFRKVLTSGENRNGRGGSEWIVHCPLGALSFQSICQIQGVVTKSLL
jgi:hypothetical protein